MGVRGDGWDAVPPRASREVLLTLKLAEIDLFVPALLLLVEAGHSMSRGDEISKGSKDQNGVRPDEGETNVVGVQGSVVGAVVAARLTPAPALHTADRQKRNRFPHSRHPPAHGSRGRAEKETPDAPLNHSASPVFTKPLTTERWHRSEKPRAHGGPGVLHHSEQDRRASISF